MRIPPFILGTTLVFWGWQTGFIMPGFIMALLLEGSRFVKLRWDFADEDFKRIWTFCALLFLAAAVYAFADSGGAGDFGRFFQGPTFGGGREAGLASARTAASLIRWQPMIFFLFIAAQAFSARQEIPLYTISFILQRRWRQARKLKRPPPTAKGVDVSYPYFALCLFAASVHPNQNNTFFWGLCALLGWVFWVRRPRRFGVTIWAGALALAIVSGYFGERSIGLLQRYIDNFNIQLVTQIFGRNRTDPSKSQTQLGQIGSIRTSTRIVIRLKPESGQPPDYLREATYRTFRSPVWFGSRSRNNFSAVDHATTNENTWLLQGDKPNASRIGIACFLSDWDRSSGNSIGLLPLPSGSTRLENLSAYVLSKNNLGAVQATGPGLLQFDALYGPGATIDSPPVTNAMAFGETNSDGEGSANWERPHFHSPWRGMAFDLHVPTNEIPAVEKVVSELGLRNMDRDHALKTLQAFFDTKFTYRMWQDSDNSAGSDETPLSRFLLKTRAGHCEYFATATVLLLREVGIPARYAVGYSVHEAGMDGYVVRQRDAHAWCIVWNEKKQTWEDFDTTPGSWQAVDAQHDSGSLWMSDAWWWARFQFSKLRWGQTHLRQYILLGLVPVLALLLFQIVRQRRRRGLNKDSGAARRVAWPGLDSEFYEIERKLGQRGLTRGTNEALSDWLERASHESLLAEFQDPLRALLRLHYRYRFDPEGLDDADREELRRAARECLEKLSRAEQRVPA